MATMMRVFAGIKYKDAKPGQCTYIDHSNAHPYIRRCTNPQLAFTNVLVCEEHSFKVTYREHEKLITLHFNGKPQAEALRKKVPWLETNYDITPGVYPEPRNFTRTINPEYASSK